MSDPVAALLMETGRPGSVTDCGVPNLNQLPARPSSVPCEVSHITRAEALLPPTIDVAAHSEKFVVNHAIGSRVFDSAGQSYLDLCMGYGALMLGHGAVSVKQALHRQLDRGWMFGFGHDLQDELALLIHEVGPANERISICNSESDTGLLALRAARAFTGRDKIAVFAQSQHGLHDFSLVTETNYTAKAANDATIRRKTHVGAGIPAVVDDAVIVLPYGEAAAIDWIRSYAGQLAAVIVEAFPVRAPSLAHGEWLHQIQAICRATNTLFVLDETMSGFRLSYGGAQHIFGLMPDLITYGNAMGGGLSIGAIAGRADVMASFGTAEPNKRIFSGTAHAGNPLSVAAAVSILNILSAHSDTVYPQLNRAAAQLAVTFNDAADAAGAGARMHCAGSMFRIIFSDAAKTSTEDTFYKHLFQRHVLVHASKRCFLSTAHTVGDILELGTAFSESLHATISS